MTMMLAACAGQLTLTVNYPATVTSTGSGLPIVGDTSHVQVGAPTYANGSGSYTWAWVRIAGSTSVGISNTTIERPAFFGTNISDLASQEAVYEVTVTDTIRNTTAKDLVTVTCIWSSTQ